MSPKLPRRVPIAVLLVVGFAGLTLVAVASVLAVGLIATGNATQELLSERAEGVMTKAVGGVERLLDPVVEEAKWIAGRVATGAANPAEALTFDAFMMGSLASTPQVNGVVVILPNQEIRRYVRGSPTVVPVRVNDASGLGELLERHRHAAPPAWDEPFWNDLLRDTLISLRTPLTRQGEFLGLLNQVVGVSSISRHLVSLFAGTGQVPYVLYDGQFVLAHPTLVDRSESPKAPLPRIDGLDDPVLASLTREKRQPIPLLARFKNAELFGIDVDGTFYIFIQRHLDQYGAKPLTVGTYFPSDLARRDVQRVWIAAAVGFAVLLIAVAVAVIVAQLTGRPIQRLAMAARALSRGDIAGAGHVPGSRIREIDDAATSFNQMIEGLKERERIRTLFGKYVPERIAQALVRDEGALGPHVEDATVLFVDIEGFTMLTERLSPQDVIGMLNTYFSALVDILERHGGVVTQFQGDAILATFNVPIPDDDHATKAVRAAIEIQAIVAARDFAGHRLACRIGIATGPVVAGSVGAVGRLSYTVHGDAVNLASRLESLNKTLGSRVLMSESTASRVRDIKLRRIGETEVAGKARKVTIYTLDA